MQKVLKTVCKSVVSLSIIAVTSVCFAAPDASRGTATAGRGRGTASARMPSIPILPVSGVGNMTVSSNNINPTPNPNPNPNPNPHPDPEPEPDTPLPNPPTPQTNCPDGGVENSSYTVENCMNDVLGCVNGGALPNGINSLFNEDLRNSIINGMGLCLTQVEHCVSTVRRNCQYVYASTTDVWLDFNARKVQPEYYAFVLRQTGLTPTQAENTCLLLDRNTYGVAFDAVSPNDRVTSEYNHKVGAYNSANKNGEWKDNPLGSEINNDGAVDGKRGYYARWDAENAQCLLRVAAYNKDDLISNRWLFGAIGDDSPAEVWQATGSSFTCNKDLFGFSLMPKTKTAAVVGIGGGTLAGAAVGAGIGHGDRDFDCTEDRMRDELLKELKDNQLVGALNAYIIADLSSTSKTMTPAQCNEIVKLYDFWQMGNEEIDKCRDGKVSSSRSCTATAEFKLSCKVPAGQESKADQILLDQVTTACNQAPCACKAIATGTANNFNVSGDCDKNKVYAKIKEWYSKNPNACSNCGNSNTTTTEQECSFVNPNKSRMYGTDVYCHEKEGCLNKTEFRRELDTLAKIFGSTTILQEGQKGNRLKTTLLGAGLGAATGGTVTAITAFVEKNNINCRVADGLAKIGLGKSYTIDRLRDFYVKWALKLPETIAPTALVTNCDNWALTCALFTDPTECTNAKFNYRPGNLSSTTLVTSPCVPSGSACIANTNSSNYAAACLIQPQVVPVPVTPDTIETMVSNCNEWVDACKTFNNNTTKCNSAKVIYVPRSMLVVNACKYNTAINECRPSAQKVNQYMDANACPIRLE